MKEFLRYLEFKVVARTAPVLCFAMLCMAKNTIHGVAVVGTTVWVLLSSLGGCFFDLVGVVAGCTLFNGRIFHCHTFTVTGFASNALGYVAISTELRSCNGLRRKDGKCKGTKSNFFHSVGWSLKKEKESTFLRGLELVLQTPLQNIRAHLITKANDWLN